MLSEDQAFLLETTRRFLAARAPDRRWCGRSSTSRPGSTADVWRRGATLGWTSLLVPEADGGGQPLRARPARPGARGRGDGPPGRRPVPSCRSTWSRRARWPRRGTRGAAGRGAARAARPATAVAAWCGPELRRCRARRRRLRGRRRGAPRSRRAPRPTTCWWRSTTATGRPKCWCPPAPPGVTTTPLGGARPGAPLRRSVRFDDVGCRADALVGPIGGRRRRRGRAPAARSPAVLQCAETVGADGPGASR